MGYTHYWNVEHCTEEDAQGLQQALPVIRRIVRRYRTILAFEHDQPDRPPVVSDTEIRMNGRGEDGHETFLFRLNGKSDFCKTARKPYDIAVCECLLVLKRFLPHLKVESDGFCGLLGEQEEAVRFDGTWNQAIQNVRRYGIAAAGRIASKRPPYCDLRLDVSAA